jgi:hypothetical protein
MIAPTMALFMFDRRRTSAEAVEQREQVPF